MGMFVFYMPSIVTTAQSDRLITARSPSSRWHVPNLLCSRGFILHQPLAEAQSHPVVCTNLSSVTKRTARRFFFQSHRAHLTEQSRPSLLCLSALKMHDGWVALKRSRYKRKHCSVCLFLLLLLQSFFTLCVRPFRYMAMTSSGSHFRQTTWGRLSAWTCCRQKVQADRGWQRYCKGCPSTTQTTKTATFVVADSGGSSPWWSEGKPVWLLTLGWLLNVQHMAKMTNLDLFNSDI